MGMCRLVLQILTLFQTKRYHFPHLFSDLASKIHTHFKTWNRSKIIMSSLLRLERQQKDFFKTISNFPHYFFSYSYGIEMTITLIHSHSSLENHTPFQTKLGKIYTLFQAKTVQLKILPFGAAHTYGAYRRKYPQGCMTAFFSNFSPTGKKYFHCEPDKINFSRWFTPVLQILPSHPSLTHHILLVPTT